ncbi:unnamed protein product [Euphydryas editha]|uniref:Integrase catalytic domain-containing protein n=1 Tax=Euphydryas editha TaxID=104508 RepID=A0AAU9TE23_EUPED|nr:unnamed protein product [Euphydryas editha]
MPKEGDFDDEKIQKLKKSKSSIKAKLTHFENYIKLASSYDSLSELHKTEMECRLSKFESLYAEFDQLQIKLEELCDPPDEQYADREAFESQYYQLLSRGRHLFATADNNGRDDSVAGSGHRSDSTTSRQWEEHRNLLKEVPNLAEFNRFLSNRADLLETIDESKPKQVKSDQSKSKNFLVVSGNSDTENRKLNKCPMCKGTHILFHCDKFRDLSIEKRIAKVKDLKENSVNSQNKTLGLNWISDSDNLSFSINIELLEKITKRHILSVISQIFDPLGLVGPTIVEAKIIMQKLWKCKLDWDTEVPDDIKIPWISFSSKLQYLNNIRIPRWVLQDNYRHVELHIFTDASEKAYGACIYARSIGTDDAVHVQLIASKNKIAPIKPTTMPRLELCGALLGARLCNKVTQSLRLKVTCRFWCDSTIVLGWLQMPVHRLKPFVRNRVNEINEITAGYDWSYVASLDNPADLVSRGVKADLISACGLWWSGPNYLQNPPSTWPSKPNERRDLPEVVVHLTQDTHNSFSSDSISAVIHKHSNLTRLIHTFAYINRFIHNCKNKHNKISGSLSLDEIQNSLVKIIRHCQAEMFESEYKTLISGKPLPNKNRLLSLSPFMDTNNIIRVGGRLNNSPYSYEQKHPTLLCSKHHITKLIFRTEHIKLLHAGPLCLLANIRQTYWPLGGRNLARYIVNKCVTCFRQRAKNVQPIMGQLPAQRTSLEYPFYNCYVDYAGPVQILDRKGRGCRLIKAYLCIFICSAVKAVHLELVTELSKEAYLAALRRFIARRGKPHSITSDNGCNFVGASNELTSFLSSSNLHSELADEGIKFSFTPPYSPHFNGLAEAAVRSAKRHLKTILNLTNLTYEEMYTLLTQIEAILNSRPISPMSTDPTDLAALTPSHFLIGRTLTAVPSLQVAEDANLTSMQRYRRVQALKQHFWKRFAHEYISLLQEKNKWPSGDGLLPDKPLVLIRDKTAPPLLWPLGRIMKTYPGVDGVSRVADIKTKKGTLRRGFNNICVLPLDF